MVLRRPKLARYVSDEDATVFVDSIVGVAEMHNDPTAGTRVLRDPDDEYLVALTTEAQADLIVSGDHDLLEAMIVATVVSPRGLVERLEEQ